MCDEVSSALTILIYAGAAAVFAIAGVLLIIGLLGLRDLWRGD